MGSKAPHIRKQFFRCATVVSPNCAEAQSAENRQDSVHKFGIVHKELEESLSWLGYLRDLEGLPESLIDSLIKENDELCRIIRITIQQPEQDEP